MNQNYKHLIPGKLYRLTKELYVATSPYDLYSHSRRILNPGEIVLITKISYEKSYTTLLFLNIIHKFGAGSTTGTQPGSTNSISIMSMEPL